MRKFASRQNQIYCWGNTKENCEKKCEVNVKKLNFEEKTFFEDCFSPSSSSLKAFMIFEGAAAPTFSDHWFYSYL